MDVNAPGLLGNIFDVEAEGRYVRIEVEDANGGQTGIGEVEIYAEPLTRAVTDLIATSQRGKKTVKLSWDLPETFDKVKVHFVIMFAMTSYIYIYSIYIYIYI